MAFININEYDQTISGPTGLANNNIVAVPINATDGPSDRWVTVPTYDTFIQLYGPNPNPLSPFGNSWEYAANMLLRDMPVCVRRITHFLDADGENSIKLLPDVANAKTAIKVRDVTGNNVTNLNLVETELNVTDAIYQSVLRPSDRGTEIPNPNYKGSFTTVYDLQTDATIRDANAFADVTDTNSEWSFVGEHVNPNYRGTKALDDILTANDTGVSGDFFIESTTNTRIDFTATPLLNQNWRQPQRLNPGDLRLINNPVAGNFVDVTLDANNETAINQVWKYQAGANTEVRNHRYVFNGVFGTPFATNTDLPVNSQTTTVGVDFWAEVTSTNTIWKFNGTTWVNTGAPIAIFAPGDEAGAEPYLRIFKIDWVNTNTAINSGLYRHHFNWVDSGSTQHLERLFWQNSNNPIGTRPHTILDGSVININNVVINTISDISTTSIKPIINGGLDIQVEEDFGETRIVSGTYGFTNISTSPIHIYSLRLTQRSPQGEVHVVYDAKLESILDNSGRITLDPLLQFKNVHGEFFNDPTPMYDGVSDRWYIELQPGATLTYSRNMSNIILETQIAGFGDFDITYNLFTSANGRYELNLSSELNTILDVTKFALPPINTDEVEDFDDLPIIDSRGNFNLFKAEYLYPGTNGNFLNLSIKTTIGQGIYIYVYRNKQYLEKIELATFRFRDTVAGRINTLDPELNKDDIWRIILLKFGIMLPYDGFTIPQSIYGNNIKIDLNPNISNFESLDYINSLFAQTGLQISSLQNGINPSDEHVVHEVQKCYTPLKDKYRYDVKFISNGGYVDKITYPRDIISPIRLDRRYIEDAMLDLVNDRRDCIAYLDIPFDLTIDDVPTYFEHISSSYAAAYDPWAFIILNTGNTKWMPPSFIHLYTHAKSIQNGNKVYMPPAGVRRGNVPEILRVNHELAGRYINEWQNSDAIQFINPILWINGYDYNVYGQKTLFNIVNQSDRYQSALQDLNVRLVANEIKKLIFRTCIELTFELNILHTWNEFKSKVEVLLRLMESEGVLTDYEILMGSETMTDADLNSGHVNGIIRVSISRAATDWTIGFELSPNSVTTWENSYDSQYPD